jgi:hypothetical protein
VAKAKKTLDKAASSPVKLDNGTAYLNLSRSRTFSLAVLESLLSHVAKQDWPHQVEFVSMSQVKEVVDAWKVTSPTKSKFSVGHCHGKEGSYEDHFVSVVLPREGNALVADSLRPKLHPALEATLEAMGVPRGRRDFSKKGAPLTAGFTCSEACVDNYVQLCLLGELNDRPLLKSEDFRSQEAFVSAIDQIRSDGPPVTPTIAVPRPERVDVRDDAIAVAFDEVTPVESCALCAAQHTELQGCLGCGRRVCPKCRDDASCDKCKGIAAARNHAAVGTKARRDSHSDSSGRQRNKRQRTEKRTDAPAEVVGDDVPVRTMAPKAVPPPPPPPRRAKPPVVASAASPALKVPVTGEAKGGMANLPRPAAVKATSRADSKKPAWGDASDRPKRFQRKKGDAIVALSDHEAEALVAEGFMMGAECLHRTPMSPEAARKKTSSHILQKLLMMPRFVIPKAKILANAMKKDTRRGHLYLLKDVLDALVRNRRTYQDMGEAMADGLNTLAEERKWVPTSVLTKSQSLHGALERIGQYSNLKDDRGDGLKLKLSECGSVWADACKTWVLDVCGYEPSVGEVTVEGMTEILKIGNTRLSTAALLILCWCTTGRPETWSKVLKDDLTLTYVPGGPGETSGYQAMVRFRYHKMAHKIGARAVPTLLPVEWAKRVIAWKKETGSSKYLFPIKAWKSTTDELLQALRRQDPTWELRCLRRGSLSTMARAGVPYETLKLFSLHGNDTMMTRYLRGGLHAGERNQKAFEAAKHLHPVIKETSTQ